MNFGRIARYGTIILILLLLGGLAAWYFFLNTQQTSLQQIADDRGFGSEVPSFSGSGGSTLENIVEGLGYKREEDAAPESKTPPRLWQVSATPTAGFAFLASATSTTLRFMERSTGYVFDVDVRRGVVRRLSNTLIPQVYTAMFSGAGTVFGSTIGNSDERRAFSAKLDVASSTDGLSSLIQTGLGAGTLAVVPSRGSPEFLSLVEDGSGSALIRSSLDGSKPERIFASGLRDWHVMWPSKDSIVIAQRPASGVVGYAYRIGKSGAATQLARGPGLTVLAHPSDAVLIGTESGTVSIAVRLSSATSSVPLPLRTVADKCVWTPGSERVAYCAVPDSLNTPRFLDAWYRGLMHTSDTWWRIDAESATTTTLYNPGSEGKSLDVERPAIDDAGEYLAFMNARDKSLWLLRIE